MFLSFDRFMVMTYRIVSADNHIEEPTDILDLLPEDLKSLAPHKVVRDGVEFLVGQGRRPIRLAYAERYGNWVDDGERRREFRDDPDTGCNLERRQTDQAADGVYAEVIYPNRFMAVSAHPNDRYQVAATRLYNDFLIDLFGGQPDRYAPVAVLPGMNIPDAIAELHRAAELGYRSALMPVSIPWLPYNEPDYDPLWSAFEETGLLCAFHVFTGNLSMYTEFADPLTIPLDRLEAYRERTDDRGFEEVLNTTVGGCTAAISPLLHLTGCGAFDKHPDLRFVLAECEAGWLAWALSTMDRMHRRRHYGLKQLELRPSEYFKRQGYITFSDDEVAMQLVELVGADRMMWSNDYPHDEGTFPTSAEVVERTMGHLDDGTREKLLSTTAADLYGFSEAWASAAT